MNTAYASRTPHDIQITPRNLNFDVGPLATDWHSGDAFKTAFYNALSIMFPIGEQHFIDSVKYYRDRITDPVLAGHVRGFTAQESIHRREHQKYNETLCASRGYPLDKLEEPIRRRQAWALKTLPPISHLASTVAYEHWTAMLADSLLRNPEALAGADPEMSALWRWHAIEESEHKAVAFDVYRAVGGTVRLRRWLMVVVTVQFFWDTFRHLRIMLRDYQGSRFKLWTGGLRYMFGKGGPYNGLLRPYLDYFRSDFHPWDHDNSEVVAEVARELELSGQPA
ncbi:MAG: metal-dependent hydrolase [Parvibaculum sp.]|uniref:metal-dependent hydrolase n=1 Tax=Parvibaculum sp. TaxID=2024848 RepID=UPI0025DF3A3D|nr:metal-dependent hydrolase [Parvibaculum sp.]MCE9650349.1 metal-dependent hydrolase [Parvibaculum sp.]